MCKPVSRAQSDVFSTEQSALSLSLCAGFISNVSAPLHRPVFERQTATDHHKGIGHPQASGRLQRSNCPCDQPGDKRATSFRRPEEDPGLCSLSRWGGGEEERKTSE